MDSPLALWIIWFRSVVSQPNEVMLDELYPRSRCPWGCYSGIVVVILQVDEPEQCMWTVSDQVGKVLVWNRPSTEAALLRLTSPGEVPGRAIL